MSGGIRNTCGRCYAIKEYDSKLQKCKKCGWTPALQDKGQKTLGD